LPIDEPGHISPAFGVIAGTAYVTFKKHPLNLALDPLSQIGFNLIPETSQLVAEIIVCVEQICSQ
jgi:hypothetical protein